MRSRFLPLLVAGFGTLALGIVLVLVFQAATGDAWAGFPLSKAGLTDEYCERNHFEDFIRQPMNAWSNLCYFFLGLWMMTAGLQDARSKRRDNPLQAFPGMSLWMGLTMVGLCFGSFFFHASLTRLGQHWDMGFTYALSLSLVAMGGYRAMALRLGDRSLGLKVAWLTAAVVAAVLMFAFKWLIDGKVALPILMLLGLWFVIGLWWRLRGRLNGWLILAGILALVLSIVCRGLDLAKIGCDPDGWLQWHAFWHLFTGLSAFCFWRVLWGERESP